LKDLLKLIELHMPLNNNALLTKKVLLLHYKADEKFAALVILNIFIILITLLHETFAA